MPKASERSAPEERVVARAPRFQEESGPGTVDTPRAHLYLSMLSSDQAPHERDRRTPRARVGRVFYQASRLHADHQPARAQGPESHQKEEQGSGAAAESAEARRLHAR